MKQLRLITVCVTSVFVVWIGILMANLAYIHLTGNIHTVEAGRLYRSGTLSAGRLERLVETAGIRTILNLRGDEGRPWYEAERAVARRHGLDFLSFHLSAKHAPDMNTVEELLFVLKTAPKPILVHCRSGSDRAGLVSALYERFVAGKSVSEAERQLSFLYGHFPWLGSRTVAMDEAFAQITAPPKIREEESVQVAAD
ncbi:tyrosine-protein phosphatase [Jiella sp. KSK16Y-1]|uniref:Tyrosine-protein phosphatase n=2 Tax=Jiella mangrovi TaxID=2821407 RepID=A0ABS4BEK1_9HYPH|nr:tyrosine-protein phosphatase [Jiella mangrovi]